MGSGKIGGGKGRKARKITRKKKQLYSIQAIMITAWSSGSLHKYDKTAVP